MKVRSGYSKMCSSLESMKNELELLEGQLQDEAGQGNCDDKIYYGSAPTFLDLPVELFLKICTFLDADFISGILAKVCRRFEFILDDTTLWKTWACERMRGTYPALPHLKIWDELEVDWRSACSEVDSECKKWSDAKNRMRHIVIKDVHFASVDTVLLVKNGQICVSGGRDRGLAMWNVLAVQPNHHQGGSTNTTITSAKPEHMHHDAHSGWVWDLAADRPENSRVVYSASWDNTVKAWDLDTGLSCIHTFQCGMSALSLTTSDNIVMAGLYSKKVLSFDIRVGTDPIATYKPHRGPVLALEHFENKIASVSEDRTLAVWDRVAGKLMTSDVKLPSEKAYPVCISWNHSALYVGDSKGSLHLLDPEELVYLKSHRVWPEPVSTQPCYKITGCVQTLASLIVCSDRGEVKFLYNAYPPRTYTTVKTTTLDITQLRYQNDVMVLGTCDSALEFWVPNEMYENLNNHL